jgi:GH18 family chitinase
MNSFNIYNKRVTRANGTTVALPDLVDQINVMSYDNLGGSSDYNDPLYTAGGNTRDSIETLVNSLAQQGNIPLSKIGFGMDFHTASDQDSYNNIMDGGQYTPFNSMWDVGAQQAYIQNGKSYDNDLSAGSKIDYIKNKGVGGMIIWGVNVGYRNKAPAGINPNELLLAIKQAAGW